MPVQQPVSRRNAFRIATAGCAVAIADPAHALIDPVTWGAIAFVGKLLMVGGILVLVANKSAYAARTNRPPGTHSDVGPDVELLPEYRGRSAPLLGGGLLKCPDGTFHALPPGGSIDQKSDMSIAEILCSEQVAPYPQSERGRLANPDATRRELERILGEPIKKLRYVRQMSDAAGVPFTMYSVIPRTRNVEVLSLWSNAGPLGPGREVGRRESFAWALRPGWDSA